jgi:excisionase family DNA binding protein
MNSKLHAISEPPVVGGTAPSTADSPSLNSKEVLTVDEVAALLRLNRKTVYEALARGEIPARRIGTTYRISRAAVLEWLRGQDRRADARRKK